MTRPFQLLPFAALAACLVAAGASVAAPVACAPTFHMAPVALPEPSDIDAHGTAVSARMVPASFRIGAAELALATARLTPQALAAHAARSRAQSAATPATTGVTAAVFTPAQIRAAYGLPDLPAAGASLSAAAAAALGAGQTIYLVAAQHHPNALEDLNRFSTKFGLPTCAAVSAAVPMPPANADCTFTVAYADNGNLRATAPAYEASWAAEIAIDVQWAHAIAPRARLVLVEAPGSMSNQLGGAVALANRMGAGVVSMSFGAPEGGWMASEDANFASPGMTYVAASGDSGSGVVWPAASARVLAVGGTSLGWSGGGTRHEVAWQASGGGVSGYVGLPSWQSGLALPGGSALARRTTADVAFNADPFTGQYVAFTAPGAATTWNAYGGTSIATPQWAGIVAIANAVRATAAKTRLGDFHATLYRSIAAVPGSYAAAFGDVQAGQDGTCTTCRAGVGYDAPTGWGTPNVSGLLPLLTGVSAAAPGAPSLPGGRLQARAGVAFSQSLGATVPSGTTVKYTLSGAPAGLLVSDGGQVRWTAPIAGTWNFTATVTTGSGVSASGRYTLVVSPDRAPAFTGGRFSATTASAFGARVAATDPDGDALTYAMTGAPAGLQLSTNGALSWAKPAAGTWTLRITARDPAGLSATVAWTIVVTAAARPTANGGSPSARRRAPAPSRSDAG